MTATATAKQIDFITKLVSERAERNHVADVDAVRMALTAQRLTKSGASALIDKLLAQPKDEPKVDPIAEQARAERDARQAVAPPQYRSNNYAGACGTCGNRVQAREGRIERINGRWVTFHLDGQCPTHLQDKLNALLADQADGYFAVPFIGREGQTDLTFFGIRTDGRKGHEGNRYVVHVIGGHGETEDVSIDWVERALAALATVDQAEAMALYGRELKHCGLCGRTLTNDASRAIGIGPECAAK